MKKGRHGLALVAIVLCSMAAASDPAIDRSEIDGLLGRIEQSSCRFIRNGNRYTGHEAAQHLRAKWQVVEARSRSSLTAEQFVIQVASSSSLSGRPYQVECVNETQGTLSAWLQEELKALRDVGPHH